MWENEARENRREDSCLNWYYWLKLLKILVWPMQIDIWFDMFQGVFILAQWQAWQISVVSDSLEGMQT